MSDANNLKLYLSGGSGNTLPSLSLGGARSNTVVSGGLATLFDHIREEEFSSTPFDTYRCIYLYNSGIDSFLDVTITFTALNVLSPCFVAFGGLNQVQPAVSNQYTAPPALTFSPSGLTIISLFASGVFLPIWIQRSVPTLSSPGVIGDSFTLQIEFHPSV